MLLCYAMMLGFSVKALSRMCSCVSVEALVLALELDLLEPCCARQSAASGRTDVVQRSWKCSTACSVLSPWIAGLDTDVLVNPGQFTPSDKHLWQSWTYWIIQHVETCNTWNKDCGPSDVPILWKELTKHILRAFPSIWPALRPWATGAMHLQQWYSQFVPWNGVAWRSDILRSTTCNMFLK